MRTMDKMLVPFILVSLIITGTVFVMNYDASSLTLLAGLFGSGQ